MNVRFARWVAVLASSLAVTAISQPVPVRYTQGAMRGFLVVRSQSGTIIGFGDYSELASGDRVTSRLILRFRDGSIDDETTLFTQRQTFRLISDHHIQRGPFFKNAIDMLVEANGDVTLKTTASDGKQKVETNHLDVPDNIANGMVAPLLLNVPHNPNPLSVGMVLPSGKGRLAQLKITPAGTAPFYAVAGDRRSANLFRIHVDLGGVAGVVAPIVGKQPSDLTIWILEGDVPLLVREQGQLSEGGPVVSIELAGTSFSHAG